MRNQKLPIKTKIAAWWMIAIGVLFLTSAGYYFFGDYPFFSDDCLDTWGLLQFHETSLEEFLNAFLLGIFFCLYSFFLFKKNKLAWKIFIVFLSFLVLYAFNGALGEIGKGICHQESFETRNFFAQFLIHGIFLILLLSDRKNFFEIAK